MCPQCHRMTAQHPSRFRRGQGFWGSRARPNPRKPAAAAVAIGEGERHANAIPIHKARSAQTFSMGDDELSAGAVRVVAVRDNVIAFHPKYIYYADPAITVVNETGAVVGRAQSIEEQAVSKEI